MIVQGRPYLHGTTKVIALESGTERVRVQALTGTHPSGMGRPFVTHACYLSPLPLKYLGGALPGEEK